MVTGPKGERINGATIEIMAQRQFGGEKTSTGQCFQLKMTISSQDEMANGSCYKLWGWECWNDAEKQWRDWREEKGW